MKGEKMLEQYPKAAKVIKDWFLDRMMESLKTDDLPDDFKEFVKAQGVDNDRIGTLIDANPRTLFDVLDDNKIFISIVNNHSDWWWGINTGMTDKKYPSRKEAEIGAIEEAVKILNEELSKNERQNSRASATEIPNEK